MSNINIANPIYGSPTTQSVRDNFATAATEIDAATALANAAVPKSGTTMTGLLVLSGNPSNVLGAATKQYVDAAIPASINLASPPPIGNTVANTGAFTTLSATGLVSGVGFSTYLASPPTIGNTAPNAGTFTTLTATTSKVTASPRETAVAMAANAIDLNLGSVFTKTISGATTLTISNAPTSGNVVAFILELMNAGTNVTWFPGVKWAGGTAPTLTAAGLDILGFYSRDGGTNWRGTLLAKDSK